MDEPELQPFMLFWTHNVILSFLWKTDNLRLIKPVRAFIMKEEHRLADNFEKQITWNLATAVLVQLIPIEYDPRLRVIEIIQYSVNSTLRSSSDDSPLTLVLRVCAFFT